MNVRRLPGRIGRVIRTISWWATIGPFCVATDLPRLGSPERRPLRLGGDSDQYPITELLGRILSFRSRLRLVRSLLILWRGVILCGLIILAARSVEVLAHRPSTVWVPLAVFLVGGWAVHLAMHHAISPFEVARYVDRRLALNAQVATAVEFTLANRLDRPLARTQVRLATNRLRDIEPGGAIPFLVPGRDARFLASIIVLYGGVSVLGSLGFNLPRQVQSIDAELDKQATEQAAAPSEFVTMDPSQLPFQSTQAQLNNPALANSDLANQLNTLNQRMQSQAISPDQYREELKQVQQQIEQQAQQSFAAQAALNALASALKDASATRSISDSLNQGQYDKAAAQLNDLSKQLSQLSPQAKQELADRLAQASQQTQKSNPNISRDAGQTAQNLRQGDTGQASQAMQSLAKSVQSASQQISGQSQLGQELQNVKHQLGDQGSQGNPNPSDAQPSANPDDRGGAPNDREAQGASAHSDQSGSPNGSPDSQQNAGSQPGQGNGNAAAGETRSSGPDQMQLSDSNGGVGNQPGAAPLGNTPNSLDTHGVRLTIVGQSGNPNAASTAAGDRSQPLTAASDSAISGLDASGGVPSNVPINVHQESNSVPLDRKPIVRDYFSDAGS